MNSLKILSKFFEDFCQEGNDFFLTFLWETNVKLCEIQGMVGLKETKF